MKLSQALAASRPMPMASQMVPFGEWLPDLGEYRNPGSTEALNVIPVADGYRPFPGLSDTTGALDARCQGFAAGIDTDGNVTVYAGDASKLYGLGLGTSAWTDLSKGGGYATAEDDTWEYTQFGQTLIATNYGDPVQSITVGGSQFADLITSTNKPKARHVEVVRDFVVLGNTNDTTDGAKPNRVWWSGINDATDFDPAASTQSDYQDIPDLGWVQRIVGGAEFGLIVCERGIVRMTYVGSPLVFRFDPIDRRRGTPIPNSVVSFGRLCFFISEEGFFVNDGTQSIPIGQNKVDRTFWNQFDLTYRSRVSAAVDPINKLVIWAFPGTGNSGEANVLFVYNWVDRKWAQVSLDVQCLAQTLSRGLSLDELDAISADLDALPFSLDSRAYAGGEVTTAAFDTSNQLNLFNGSNLAATLETPLTDLGRRSVVMKLHPYVDGGTVTAKLDGRATLATAESFGSSGSTNANGDITLRSEGRYHKAQVSIAAGGSWTRAQGVEMHMAQAGVR